LRSLAQTSTCDTSTDSNFATATDSGSAGATRTSSGSHDDAVVVADSPSAKGSDGKAANGAVEGVTATNDESPSPGAIVVPAGAALDLTTYLAIGAFIVLLLAAVLVNRIRTRRLLLRYYAE
jgi:hypothetical protein